MKKSVFRKIACPLKLYFVPAPLACVNISIFVTIILITISTTNIDPLIFVLLTIMVHIILVAVCKKEPHMGELLKMRNKDVHNQKNTNQHSVFVDKYDADHATVISTDGQLMNVFAIDTTVLETSVPAQYLKQMAEKNVSLRFFCDKAGRTYLITSYKQLPNFDTRQIINITQTELADYHPVLLSVDSQITPGDVFKLMLNPTEDETFSVGSSLSESSLLTCKRTLLSKDVMMFEQKDQKVYMSVLSLYDVQSVIDLDVLKSFTQDANILICITPCSTKKSEIIIEQKRRAEPFSRIETTQAKCLLDQGAVFGYYSMNIYVQASSLQQLESKRQNIINMAKNNGLLFKTETWYLPRCFYEGLPTYQLPRRLLLPF